VRPTSSGRVSGSTASCSERVVLPFETAVPFMPRRNYIAFQQIGATFAPTCHSISQEATKITKTTKKGTKTVKGRRPCATDSAAIIRRVSTQTVRLHRWDEIALEKVTEMISRKIVTGDREMVAQIYLKKGALVPMHSHESEQMTYVLQGAMKFLVGGEEITLREGEVLHIPSWVEHQAEALDDTFELDVFSPIRQDWLDHTDTYFHK
jgi:quercetin dioxygenase-like cupin family protein